MLYLDSCLVVTLWELAELFTLYRCWQATCMWLQWHQTQQTDNQNFYIKMTITALSTRWRPITFHISTVLLYNCSLGIRKLWRFVIPSIWVFLSFQFIGWGGGDYCGITVALYAVYILALVMSVCVCVYSVGVWADLHMIVEHEYGSLNCNKKWNCFSYIYLYFTSAWFYIQCLTFIMQCVLYIAPTVCVCHMPIYILYSYPVVPWCLAQTADIVKGHSVVSGWNIWVCTLLSPYSQPVEPCFIYIQVDRLHTQYTNKAVLIV